MVIGGEISAITYNAFWLSISSAHDLAGAALIVDDSGRAVGYLGNSRHPQHLSYAFKFDEVVALTNRDERAITTLVRSAPVQEGGRSRSGENVGVSMSPSSRPRRSCK